MDLVEDFKSWYIVKEGKAFDALTREEKVQALKEYAENTEQFAARRRAAIRAIQRKEKLA